jgi:hypothetical protein
MEETLDISSVGEFEEWERPRSDGRYRYMPFRSRSHFILQAHLRAGRQPRCHYDEGDVRVSFTVSSCPEYGVLELRDFARSPIGPATELGMSPPAGEMWGDTSPSG